MSIPYCKNVLTLATNIGAPCIFGYKAIYNQSVTHFMSSPFVSYMPCCLEERFLFISKRKSGVYFVEVNGVLSVWDRRMILLISLVTI